MEIINMSGTESLQQIIGVDKKNPYITIWRKSCAEENEAGKLYVFFGTALMEIVSEDKKSPEYKLLIARLYNAGLKVKSLTEQFGIPRSTMQRWGDALKEGDGERLVRVLSGAKYPRKLTPDILSFAEVRFKDIYKDNRYSYIKEIREEIKSIFNKEISSEALRPHFKRWKEEEVSKQSAICLEEQKDCDMKSHGEVFPVAELEDWGCTEREDVNGSNVIEEDKEIITDNRKPSLSYLKSSDKYLFCHHAGVLLFSGLIFRVDKNIQGNGAIVRQWISTILLGAVNIEQSKLLDFDSLEVFYGEVIRSLVRQRMLLEVLTRKEQYINILKV